MCSSDLTVSAPTDCAATETTAAPVTTSAPASTVAAVVVTAGSSAGGGVTSATTAEGTLPFTGTSTTVPLLAGGLVLIAAGLAAVGLGRSRSSRNGSKN